MREIKFRAWDKKENKMFLMYEKPYYDGEYQDYNFKVDFQEPDEDENLRYGVDSDNWELMQYTGLLDKNGIEIYEGDIVKAEEHVFQDENPLEVRYGFYDDDGDSYGWYIKGRFETAIVWEKKTTLDYLEVIGNIYENSNLLK